MVSLVRFVLGKLSRELRRSRSSLIRSAEWILRYVRPVAILSRLARFFTYAFIGCHALLFILILGACFLLSKWNPPVTSLMIYRDITVHQKTRPVSFVPLRQIPYSARQMFIRLEDMRFYSHPGIDLGAIRDAYRVNKAIGYTLYGGSTIPQQLARTLFLTPRKTYLRKYVEALIALEMDLFLKKERLLELYLNYIEWGKGVYGIGAASRYYFQAGPASLSIDELRRLVTILPNPLRFDVDTFSRSRQMTGRYRYLVERFPDPAAAPAPQGESDEGARPVTKEPSTDTIVGPPASGSEPPSAIGVEPKTAVGGRSPSQADASMLPSAGI